MANQTAWSKPEGNTLPTKWDMYVSEPPRKATLVRTDKENEEIM